MQACSHTLFWPVPCTVWEGGATGGTLGTRIASLGLAMVFSTFGLWLAVCCCAVNAVQD